jgi:hypothetical protein
VKGQIPGVSGALTGVRSFQTSVGGRWVVLLPRRKNVMGDFNIPLYFLGNMMLHNLYHQAAMKKKDFKSPFFAVVQKG